MLSVEVLSEMNHASTRLEYQREVKVLCWRHREVLLGGLRAGRPYRGPGLRHAEEFRKVFEQIARLDKPMLAVVAGPALSAGSILAAGCDIVLAGASARFGHPEIKGRVFNPVAAALLPRLVGRKKAFEMILGGGLLTAAEAERIGLVSRVLPDERLEAEAAALVQRLQEGSAPILQATRRAIAGGLDLLLPDALSHAQDVYLNQLMATEDAEEGLKAVMAKRKPAWKDK